jgi:mono/diheme cytochrome c family protein
MDADATPERARRFPPVRARGNAGSHSRVRAPMRWIHVMPFAIALAGPQCEGTDASPPSVVPDTGATRAAIEAPPAAPARADLTPPRLQPLAASHVSSSPLVLATLADRTVAVIADEDEHRVVVIDATTGDERIAAALSSRPAHVLLDPRGRLYISLRDTAEVVALELACAPDVQPCVPTFLEHDRWSTPAEPIALGLADDDATLLVTCGWGRALVGIALTAEGRELAIPLAREPRGFAIDRTGDRVFVAHAVGSRISVIALATGTVVHERELHWRDEVGTRDWKLTNVPRLAVQGIAVAAASDRVLVPMVLAYPGEPETAAAGYGMSVDGFDPFFPHEPVVVDLDPSDTRAHLRLRHEVIAADDARLKQQRRKYKAERPPCLLPRAVAIDEARDRMLVACQDLGQIVAIAIDDRPLDKAEARRWRVGAGTNAVAVDPTSGAAWAWSPFDRRLDRLADDGTIAQTIDIVATTPVPDAEGRRAFHHPRGFDGRSCASCHIDGRDDGLVWQSPRGLVQTPVLAGRTDGTAPFGWRGEAPTIEAHMQRTFERLRAEPPDAHTLAVLAQYIAAMPTSRGPAPALGPAAERGRELFRSSTTGCADCHADDVGTDGVTHRIGRQPEIDTPSLRFVGDTPPYMHDGRFSTLREVIAHTEGKMGTTDGLDDAQIADLIAYLRVL